MFLACTVLILIQGNTDFFFLVESSIRIARIKNRNSPIKNQSLDRTATDAASFALIPANVRPKAKKPSLKPIPPGAIITITPATVATGKTKPA